MSLFRRSRAREQLQEFCISLSIAYICPTRSVLVQFESAYCCNLPLVLVPPLGGSQGRFVHLISLAFRKLDESLRYQTGFCFRVHYRFLLLPDVRKFKHHRLTRNNANPCDTAIPARVDNKLSRLLLLCVNSQKRLEIARKLRCFMSGCIFYFITKLKSTLADLNLLHRSLHMLAYSFFLTALCN